MIAAVSKPFAEKRFGRQLLFKTIPKNVPTLEVKTYRAMLVRPQQRVFHHLQQEIEKMIVFGNVRYDYLL